MLYVRSTFHAVIPNVELFDVQTSFRYSAYTMHDSFGILLILAMLTTTFFDTILQRFLLHNPQDLCYPVIAASVLLYGECILCSVQTADVHFCV